MSGVPTPTSSTSTVDSGFTSTSVPRTSSASSTSPGQKARVEEKRELQNLNRRLAVYIDNVRSLQEENKRLEKLLAARDTSAGREVDAVKKAYEEELAEAKALLEEATKEKASLQTKVRTLKAQKDDVSEK